MNTTARFRWFHAGLFLRRSILTALMLIGVFRLAIMVVGNLDAASSVEKASCPITRPTDHPFVPPKPYSPLVGRDEFLYGSAALWTVVERDWRVHIGGKLPFFRQGFVWNKDGRPILTVVARRLDGEGPLVWSGPAGSGFMEGQGLEGMFMVTGIDIPSSGCWEIGAHYVDPGGKVQTLAYTVWVEP
jgi:hypothetical protein